MPTQTLAYRVVKIMTIGFADAKVEESIVWQGGDIIALSKQYPPSEIMFADELGHHEIEGGHIRWHFRFEQEQDGQWIKIDDPRKRVTPITETERAIDAENRRLFPGDYGLADDGDDCYCGLSSCPECGQQDYDQFDCDNCRDAGCSQCDPSEEAVCAGYCGRSLELSELNEHGLCADCEEIRIEEEKPRCIDCDTVTVSNTGDVCSFCQEWRDEETNPRCCACGQVHTDPQLHNGDICKACDDYFRQQEELAEQLWHVPWYRRLINRLTRRS